MPQGSPAEQPRGADRQLASSGRWRGNLAASRATRRLSCNLALRGMLTEPQFPSASPLSHTHTCVMQEPEALQPEAFLEETAQSQGAV